MRVKFNLFNCNRQVVRLGEHNVNDDIYDGASPEDFQIEAKFLHPQFERKTLRHDFAILKLNRDVQFKGRGADNQKLISSTFP